MSETPHPAKRYRSPLDRPLRPSWVRVYECPLELLPKRLPKRQKPNEVPE